jgi:hypothetical protein
VKIFGPILLLGLGIFLIIGGDAVANSEENVANAVGGLASNTFFAIALIAAGGLWLYMTTGHFKRISA